MAFRTRRGSHKFNQAACQAGKERVRMSRPFEDRPPERDNAGKVVRQIVVRDLELGVEHVFDCIASKQRCDSYHVLVDGSVGMAQRMGWTDAVELAGKSFVRVLSARNLP